MASTKLTFDPANKLIICIEAPVLVGGVLLVEQDIKQDFYSDAKEDWLADDSLNKFRFPMESVGGDETTGSKSLGATFFLKVGWKIRPYEGSHTYRLNGNLYTRDGSSVFTSTLGVYQILTEMVVSSLVDSTVQQLSEIEYASFGGGVSVDATSLNEGIEYPVGNQAYPVNNLPDAVVIANLSTRGFKVLFLRVSMLLDDGTVLSNFTLSGWSRVNTLLEMHDSLICDGLSIKNCNVFGVLDGGTHIESCSVGDINYVNGEIHHSGCYGLVYLGGNKKAVIANCYTIDQDAPLIVDMGVSGQSLSMPNYSGLVTIRNFNSPDDEIGIGLNAGMAMLEDTVTQGNIIVAGNGMLLDQRGEEIHTGIWNGGVNINTVALINNNSIAATVLNTVSS